MTAPGPRQPRVTSTNCQRTGGDWKSSASSRTGGVKAATSTADRSSSSCAGIPHDLPVRRVLRRAKAEPDAKIDPSPTPWNLAYRRRMPCVRLGSNVTARQSCAAPGSQPAGALHLARERTGEASGYGSGIEIWRPVSARKEKHNEHMPLRFTSTDKSHFDIIIRE